MGLKAEMGISLEALRRAMHGFGLLGSTEVVLLKDISVYRAEKISFSCLCFDIGLHRSWKAATGGHWA